MVVKTREKLQKCLDILAMNSNPGQNSKTEFESIVYSWCYECSNISFGSLCIFNKNIGMQQVSEIFHRFRNDGLLLKGVSFQIDFVILALELRGYLANFLNYYITIDIDPLESAPFV